jgi:hypothetical protein
MLIYEEVPIWVTLAIQMLFDVKDVFESENTLAKPFKEYRNAVRKCSAEFEQIDPIEPQFLEHQKTTKVGPLYQNARKILKDHHDIAVGDRWGRLLKMNDLHRHEVLGKTVNNRDWSKS